MLISFIAVSAQGQTGAKKHFETASVLSILPLKKLKLYRY
jgi:hypothetical protein